MRIISKFKDYYDSAMAYGQDQSIVYVRHTSEEDTNRDFGFSDMPRLMHKIGWYRGGLVKMAILFFCGKSYPFYFDDFEHTRYFSFETIWPSNKVRSYSSWNSLAESDYRKWVYENYGKPTQVNIDLQCPIVLVIRAPQNPDKLIRNPCLRDYHIQKLFDPYNAFQEISMYVGGVLANTKEPPSPMTDKQKVISHGMDPKYGFRKPPQG